jgi:hypothetical protein
LCGISQCNIYDEEFPISLSCKYNAVTSIGHLGTPYDPQNTENVKSWSGFVTALSTTTLPTALLQYQCYRADSTLRNAQW